MTTRSRVSQPNRQEETAIARNKKSSRHHPETSGSSTASKKKQPSPVTERVLIDIHELADALFGRTSSRLPTDSIELQWKGQGTETTLEDRDDEEAMLIKRTLVSELLPPKPSPNSKNKKPRSSTNGSMITTSSRQLAIVLGKVVDVVLVAERSGKEIDCSALEALVHNLEAERGQRCYDDELFLTYEELNKIVMRVVESAKESVTKGTRVPTGICISNFGSRRCCIDLFWGTKDVTGSVVVASGDIRTKASF
jgi:hypothetical protein